MTIDTHELRRKLGSDDLIDHVDIHANVKPTLTELIDRLEAAERERDALRAELAVLRSSMTFRTSLIGRIEAERDALQAKVEAMEKQKPVATVRINVINGNPSVDFVPGLHYLHHNDKLYLAPGAQPAPIAPQGWKLVPTAESRHPGIYKMLGALHTVDNTPGASEWESYAAFLEAAPESRP